jgi:hypothetical protein
MNGYSHEHFFDPQILDRLVDGELAEAERREVLQTLERQPDGWRQCALAFLEAQSWGDALTELARHPESFSKDHAGAGESEKSLSAAAAALKIESDRPERDDGGNVPASLASGGGLPSQGTGGWNSRWLSFMALAGSFLVTFSLGMYAQQYLRPSSDAGTVTAMTQGSAVGPHSGPVVMGPTAPSAQNAVVSSPLRLVDLDVTLPDGRRQRVRVPAIDNRFAAFFAQPQVPQLSPQWQAALERTQSQLLVRREFMAVPLGNNQQAIVPFDRFQIVPVRATQ